MNTQHTSLAKGRWSTFSLAEQLAHVGSEIHRARRAEETHPERFTNAADRALELLDLTLADRRWIRRRLELGRMRDLIADAILGGAEYGATFASLESYFDRFALLAATQRHG